MIACLDIYCETSSAEICVRNILKHNDCNILSDEVIEHEEYTNVMIEFEYRTEETYTKVCNGILRERDSGAVTINTLMQLG